MPTHSDNADMLTRRIAVTGATGMLGGHLVAELIRTGHTDITLVVRDAGRTALTMSAIERLGITVPDGVLRTVETQLTDPTALTDALPDIDTVFNCAARIMSGSMTPAQLIDNNVAIARSVTEWCLRCGVRKLIHVSSISALGEPPSPEEPITEECEPAHIETHAAYGRSKYYSAREIWRGASSGLEVGGVSPGGILAAGG